MAVQCSSVVHWARGRVSHVLESPVNFCVTAGRLGLRVVTVPGRLSASITVCDLVHSVDLGHAAVTPGLSFDLSEPI